MMTVFTMQLEPTVILSAWSKRKTRSLGHTRRLSYTAHQGPGTQWNQVDKWSFENYLLYMVFRYTWSSISRMRSCCEAHSFGRSSFGNWWSRPSSTSLLWGDPSGATVMWLLVSSGMMCQSNCQVHVVLLSPGDNDHDMMINMCLGCWTDTITVIIRSKELNWDKKPSWWFVQQMMMLWCCVLVQVQSWSPGTCLGTCGVCQTFTCSS